MPATQENVLLYQSTDCLPLALEPAVNALESLLLVACADELEGLDPWVVQTAAGLDHEAAHLNRLVFESLSPAVVPDGSWESFEAYLVSLARMDPQVLRDRVVKAYLRRPLLEGLEGKAPSFMSVEDALESADRFLALLRSRFSKMNIDEQLELEAYHYLTQPEKMQTMLVDHLDHMWTGCLKQEWERRSPELEEVVQAFCEADWPQGSFQEQATYLCGQTHELWHKLTEYEGDIVFVPSPHAGPNLGKYHSRTQDLIWVVFGARLPEVRSWRFPEQEQVDLMVRLVALADTTRLKILYLVREQIEVCAQQIIEELGITQSTASRHLRHLSDSGILSERRIDSAKCYRLNHSQAQVTLSALEALLS